MSTTLRFFDMKRFWDKLLNAIKKSSYEDQSSVDQVAAAGDRTYR